MKKQLLFFAFVGFFAIQTVEGAVEFDPKVIQNLDKKQLKLLGKYLKSQGVKADSQKIEQYLKKEKLFPIIRQQNPDIYRNVSTAIFDRNAGGIRPWKLGGDEEDEEGDEDPDIPWMNLEYWREKKDLTTDGYPNLVKYLAIQAVDINKKADMQRFFNDFNILQQGKRKHAIGFIVGGLATALIPDVKKMVDKFIAQSGKLKDILAKIDNTKKKSRTTPAERSQVFKEIVQSIRQANIITKETINAIQNAVKKANVQVTQPDFNTLISNIKRIMSAITTATNTLPLIGTVLREQVKTGYSKDLTKAIQGLKKFIPTYNKLEPEIIILFQPLETFAKGNPIIKALLDTLSEAGNINTVISNYFLPSVTERLTSIQTNLTKKGRTQPRSRAKARIRRTTRRR